MPTPEEEWKAWVEKIDGQVGGATWPTWYGDPRPMPPKPLVIDPQKVDPKKLKKALRLLGLEKQNQVGGRSNPELKGLYKWWKVSGFNRDVKRRLKAHYLKRHLDDPAEERFEKYMKTHRKGDETP